MKAGHHDQAAKIFAELVKRQPQNPELLVDLGESQLNDFNDMAGDHMKAERCFKQAIKINPQLGRAYRAMAEWAIAQGRYDFAIDMASKSVTVKQPDAKGFLVRSIAYENQHKDKLALADLDNFLSQQSDKGAYKRRATILEKFNMHAKALSDYRVIQKVSYDGGIALREAVCLEKLNKNEEAIACLDRLLKHSPEDDAAYEVRGRIMAKLGRLKESAQDFSKAIQLVPSATLLRQRSIIYEKMGKKDLATRDRKEAEKI